MEPGQESSDSAVVRRRRRVARPTREQTPEPGLAAARRNYSDESSSNFDQQAVQTVRMQIRPPGTMSAHESKILRRRDKTFASAAARSHSQPRQAERLSSPEAFDLIRTVEKRSLSSPRHKEESSEGERYATSPEIVDNYPGSPSRLPPGRQAPKEDENLSRLELNLRRFEDERRRFEMEKRIFEKEKREHKVRYKQYLDNEERKRLMENYRKMSDRMHVPNDPEERRRVVQSLRLSRNEAAVRQKQVRPSRYESSTPVSSSESEAVQAEDHRKNHRSPPPPSQPSQKYRPKETSPPSVTPQAPPVPVRRSVSRNNSLSPIRPARRSKTPDTSNNASRKSSIEELPTVTTVSTDNIERKRSFRNSSYENELQQRALEEIYRNATSEETKTQSLGRKKSLRNSEKRNGYVEDDEDPQTNGSRKSSIERELERKRNTIEENLEKARKLSLEKAEALQLARKRSLEKAESLQILRKRSLEAAAQPKDQAILNEKPDVKLVKQPSLISRFIAYMKRPKTASTKDETRAPAEKLLTKVFFREMSREFRFEWLKLKADYPRELDAMCRERNKCLVNFIILVLLCGFGGLMFRYTEGSLENIYKCEVRKVKRDFIDHLWTVSHNMREDDWKSAARTKLRKFEEELHAMQELGIRRFPGMKSWNFVNCVLYCWTVITTIGYGHITPQTVLGRSLTVIYAIIGIPMFLILLADFGKLFTRAIKFVWAYVRRIYYTGTCRKVRKQQQVMDVISGFNTMYDYAVRRPSQYFGNPNDEESAHPDAPSEHPPISNQLYPNPQTPGSHVPSHLETPSTPYPETFEVNDEFNLPISLASVILVSYILVGAFVYTMWEEWTYFEAFYFVFVSMSTIGFGDFVPNHPIFMMCSIIYLIFGLALTSMFINVVQIKLSNTFKDASAKIGATIGLTMAEGSESIVPTPSDIASVHIPKLGTIGEAMSEELSPSDVINLPPPTFEPGPPPLLPKKGTLAPEPEEKPPKKKKGFFKK
ncbi:trichohyalin [Eupeodes corollae]|uniref:trichohyalin n=1 Tax=Eupeodes corollae TaxID=290404 RepID=UPI002491DC3B|nr:trichohyalin [Eupeodes corollae]